MSPTDIAAHLDERFRLLTGKRRGRVERHQTLRATVEWSYQLLDDRRPRRCSTGSAMFAGTFDAAAAIAVGERRRARRVAGHRRDREPGGEVDAGRRDRARRHDPLRDARDAAPVRPRATRRDRRRGSWRRRHAEHYAAFAEDAGLGCKGSRRAHLDWRASTPSSTTSGPRSDGRSIATNLPIRSWPSGSSPHWRRLLCGTPPPASTCWPPRPPPRPSTAAQSCGRPPWRSRPTTR